MCFPQQKFSLVRDTLKYLALSGEEAGALPLPVPTQLQGQPGFSATPCQTLTRAILNDVLKNLRKQIESLGIMAEVFAEIKVPSNHCRQLMQLCRELLEILQQTLSACWSTLIRGRGISQMQLIF